MDMSEECPECELIKKKLKEKLDKLSYKPNLRQIEGMISRIKKEEKIWQKRI